MTTVESDGLWKSMMWTSNTSTAEPGILEPEKDGKGGKDNEYNVKAADKGTQSESASLPLEMFPIFI